MSTRTNNQISLSQFVFIIYKTQIGIAIITIPRDLSVVTGTDGWITLLIGWGLTILVSCMIVYIMSRHPEATLFDLLPRYFGKWVGKIIHGLWVLYAIVIASIAIVTIVHLMQVWISPNIAPFFLMFLFLVPIYMILRQDLTIMGRFSEVVFLLTLWMPPILLFSLREVEWLYLLPIAGEGWVPILEAVPVTFLSFLGFELVFVIYPYLRKKKAAYKAVTLANTMTFFITMTPIIICFVKFSQEEIIEAVWPTLDLLKLIQFPFLERLEIIFLSFYLFVLLSTVISYLYLFLEGFNQLFQRSKHQKLLRQSVLVVVLISWLILILIYSPSSKEIVWLQAGLKNISLIFSYLFPFFLFIYVGLYQWTQKRKGLSL